jgi:putative membrane protein|tara:strand:+ start:81 stop:599 length:519 start_codon:yes stop_codon:yes gene_type:complete
MSENNKYGIWIKIISVAIPVVVAILFGVRVDYELPIFLPPIYSSLNALTAVLLVLALVAIKSKKIKLHQRLMQTCIALSLVFLVMYIAYHMTTDPTTFGGEGYVKSLYFFILISHILLSIALIPLVLISYVRAFQEEFPAHRKISKITFPIWLYVAVTGVVVYLMISPYYVY